MLNSKGKTGKVRNMFNYVADKKEFVFDNREFINSLGIPFENKVVLDAGCGQGITSCYIANEMNGAKVAGCDVRVV